MPHLRNDLLSVELDDASPLVLAYQLPDGTAIDGATMTGSGPVAVLTVNGHPCPWHQWDITLKPAASYTLEHRREKWKLRFDFRLDAAALVMTMTVVADPAKTLNTISFEHLPLIACTDTDSTYWRETWTQGPWNFFPPWPQPYCGTFACTGFQRQLLRDAIVDAAPLPTVHACFFKGPLCCFVKTNLLHLPLLTRVAVSDRFPLRAGSYSLGPNTYQYRVRDKLLDPLEVRVVFTPDLNADGSADQSDYHLWLNRQYPAPNPLYIERVWYKIFNARGKGDVSTTYAQSLQLIEAIHHITDGLPQMCYLVGWQYDGHDTGFPSHDRLNPALGTRDELVNLCRVAKEKFNCIISYHINVDDAYPIYPGWDESLMCRDVTGQLMPWQIFNDQQSYHLCHTKDVESGAFVRRMDAMLNLIPVEQTIHLDAFRYFNWSWDGDEFIGPMEELLCGMRPILDYFKSRGIDVSTEAVDAWPMDVPGWISAVWHMDEYWRVQVSHAKVLGGGRYPAIGGWGMGAAVNRDFDHPMVTNELSVILDYLYLGAILYLFYAQREMLHLEIPPHQVKMRFSDGLTVDMEARKEHLKVMWNDVTIADGNDRFVPLWDAIYLYSRDGSKGTWRLPPDFRGIALDLFTLTRTGRTAPPPHELSSDSLMIDLPPRTPVKVLRRGR